MFAIILKYFWAAALVVAVLNTTIAASRSKRFIAKDPTLRDGYRQMLRHYCFWTSLPWVIMGAGVVFGGVPTVFHYFQPRQGDPYVLAFHALAIVLWVLLLYWVFAKNGAEMLIRHPGFLSSGVREPWMIKGFITLSVTGGVIGEIIMWTVDIPLDKIVGNI